VNQVLPSHDSGFGEFMRHPVDYTRKHLGKVLVFAASAVAGVTITAALLSGGTRGVESSSSSNPDSSGSNNKPGLPAAVVNREVEPDEPTTIPTPTSSSTPRPLPPTSTPQPIEQPTAVIIADPVAEATARITATLASPDSETKKKITVDSLMDYLNKFVVENGMGYTVTKSFDAMIPGMPIRFVAISVDDSKNPMKVNGQTLKEAISSPRIGTEAENRRFIELVGKYYKSLNIQNPYLKPATVVDLRSTSGSLFTDDLMKKLVLDSVNSVQPRKAIHYIDILGDKSLEFIIRFTEIEDMNYRDQATGLLSGYKATNPRSIFLSIQGYPIKDSDFRAMVSNVDYTFTLDTIK